jgi:hypothetical protein
MAMDDRRGTVVAAIAVLLLTLGAGAAVVVANAVDAQPHRPAAPGSITSSDQLMAWLARVLLVLAVAWLVIGIFAARTSLVRRPGAAAARASWLAGSGPWRARESTLGMLSLDRWLLFAVPVALLVATRAVQSSFTGWLRLVVVIGAWTVFALALRVLVRGRSPWPVIAAVGGAVVLRCVLTLVALSFAGPGGYWYAFWEVPVLRGVYVTIAFALFLWLFVAAGWSLFAQLGPRRGVGAVLCAVGAAVAVPALLVAVIGIERALTVWDDRAGLLPWGLERIVAVTLRLDIPDTAVWWVAVSGLVVLVTGALMALRVDARPVASAPDRRVSSTRQRP